MLLESDKNLEKLIEEEKQRVALEFFQDAWESAVREGIEASILAESAIVTALTKLQTVVGESGVSDVVDALPDRIASGHFDENRCLQ